MKRYLVGIELFGCMICSVYAAPRKPFNNKKIVPKPHPIVKPARPPRQPTVPRLFHFIKDEQTHTELVSCLHNLNLRCFSYTGLRDAKVLHGELLVVSNIDLLSQAFDHVDTWKCIILWIRERCLQEHYEQIRALSSHTNVHIVVSTPYEKRYLSRKGICMDRATVIWPLHTQFVSNSDRSTVFLDEGLHASYVKRVVVACAAQGIQVRNAQTRETPYGVVGDGMLCFPGVMPDYKLFEYLQCGIIPFVPTIRFLKRLGYAKEQLTCVETTAWYAPEYEQYVCYFNAWDDLKVKMQTIDYEERMKQVEDISLIEQRNVAACWRKLVEEAMK